MRTEKSYLGNTGVYAAIYRESLMMIFDNYVCVDLETTGLVPEKNEIIEIGMVKYSDGRILDRYQMLVKPNRKVPPFIFKLTSINPKDLEKAVPFDAIAEEVREFIGNALFVAHNLPFDFGTLNTSFERMGLSPLQNCCLDTRDLALILLSDQQSHKLQELAHYFKIPFAQEHRALSDAECVGEIIAKMRPLLKTVHPLVIRLACRCLPDIPYLGLKTLFSETELELSLTKGVDFKAYLSTADESTYRFDRGCIPDATEARLESCFQPREGEEQRDSQKALSLGIFQALQAEKHGVFEAGTGVGKTRAYLAASLLHGLHNRTSTIVSTKTKLLQHQILEKEVPLLKNLLGCEFTVTLIKGKENYIDISRFEDLLQRVESGQSMDFILFLGLFLWVLKTDTGDLTELHPEIHRRFYEHIKFLPFLSASKPPKQCFLQKIRRDVKESDLVISNHALVFSDFTNEQSILPPSPVIIFDESHSIEDVAASATSVSYQDNSIKEILAFFKDDQQHSFLTKAKDARLYLESADQLFLDTSVDSLSEQAKALDGAHRAFMSIAKDRFFSETSQSSQVTQVMFSEDLCLSEGWRVFCELKEQLETAFSTLISNLESLRLFLEALEDPLLTEILYFRKFISDKLSEVLNQLRFIFDQEPGFISWFDFSKSRRGISLKLVSAPITIQDFFRDQFYATKSSVIFISATLRVKESFDFFMSRLGLSEETTALGAWESGFDLCEQGVLGILENLAEFDGVQEIGEQQAEVIVSNLKHFQGKTLILFTSKSSLKHAEQLLKKKLKHEPIMIISQTKSANKEKLISQFRLPNQATVILGLDTFWEGIDIKGKDLQSVIIPKLPFPVPSEPLHHARMKAIEGDGGTPFMEYLLPLAIIKLKQGIGRLIRSKEDRGVILILDPRLKQKSYGRLFLRELSAYKQVTGSIEAILESLG